VFIKISDLLFYALVSLAVGLGLSQTLISTGRTILFLVLILTGIFVFIKKDFKRTLHFHLYLKISFALFIGFIISRTLLLKDLSIVNLRGLDNYFCISFLLFSYLRASS
jgi:uncharacterized membrane protein